ncbi:MAG: hypothetical protein V1753_02045 [Pseudomonadota bacterium]
MQANKKTRLMQSEKILVIFKGHDPFLKKKKGGEANKKDEFVKSCNFNHFTSIGKKLIYAKQT